MTSRPGLPVWQLALIALAVLALYFPVLRRLVIQWTDPNFSHGVFVPAFSLFVLWEKRARLAELPVKPAWSGLALLGFGLAVLTLGVMGAELFLSRVSLLFVLAGLTALLLGWNFVRAVLFPLLFLLLMIPIPAIVLNQITSPLQSIASITSASILRQLGVPVLREGNILNLPRGALDVVEACSGLRSLMSLTALAIIYGYLTEPRTSIRVILALASVPIAVIANSLRIVVTGLIVQHWGLAKAQGVTHELTGLLIFLSVSFLSLFLLHRFLRWMMAGRVTV